MKFNVVVAAVIVIALSAWMIFGQLSSEEEAAEAAPDEDPLPSVRFRLSEAVAFQGRVTLRGHTEASRSTVLNAEIGGKVLEIVAQRGANAKAGEVLIRLDAQDFPEQLAAAEALVALRHLQHAAASKLQSAGQESEARLAESKAFLEEARSAQAAIALALDRTKIRAPFDGIFNERLVEVGGYVAAGDPLASFLALEALIVTAEATEREIRSLRVGQSAEARIGERRIEGRIRYLSRQADSEVRTYTIELEIPNSDRALTAGQTADIVAPTEEIPAHNVSPGLLYLGASTEGELGLKVLQEDDTVKFYEAEILASADDGVWVGGLPERARIITVGQGFVAEGAKVVAIDETTIE